MMVLDVATTVVGFAANWLLQSTLLIAAGLAAAWLLRRRGAAGQSIIYRTTLAAVLLCPLATLVLSQGGVSGWSIEMPVAWAFHEQNAAASESEGRSSVAPLLEEPQGDTPGALADKETPISAAGSVSNEVSPAASFIRATPTCWRSATSE